MASSPGIEAPARPALFGAPIKRREDPRFLTGRAQYVADIDLPGMAHLAFDGEGPRIELFEYLSPAGGRHISRPADVGFAHICVACDDIEERLERLVAAGGEAMTGPVTVDTGANAGGRGLYLRDPDGHVVELFERPAA